MRVYDTFLFAGELDMLECRLYELQDSDVYMHVIVEGTTDFQGHPKPLVYDENRDRFAKWSHRIRYVTCDPSTDQAGPPVFLDAVSGAREYSCRQATHSGLLDAQPEDVVIHGDVDEIISSHAIDYIHGLDDGFYTSPFKFSLRMVYAAVDWLFPIVWGAPSVMRVGQCDDFISLRYLSWPVIPSDTGFFGTHLTWLGGPEAIIKKVHTYSHTEVIEEVTSAVADGRYYERGQWRAYNPDGPQADWTQFEAVDIDETWPQWVYERKCPAIWFRPR